MKKRILMCQFFQETNTFNPIVMTQNLFNNGIDGEDPKVFENRMLVHGTERGAMDAFVQAGAEVIPTVFYQATSTSGGRVADSVLTHMMERMTYYVQTNSFDAIYASLHGATCTETVDDACGALLEHLRKLAGGRPIAASFDLHANITEKVLKNADIICGYHTYPHRDFYETGYRAGKLLLKLLDGKRLSLASASVPMLIPPAGYTTDDVAFANLIAKGKRLVDDGVLVDFSVFPVQPWLDIAEISSRVIAIAEDSAFAMLQADVLAHALCDLRQDTMPQMLSVDEIIDIAENNDTGKPVILCESADSPNGGCVGDSPIVAMRILERKSQLRTGLFVVDPIAAEQAFALGVGGQGEFSVGAGFTPNMPGPMVAKGTVLSLHDGNFMLEGPANRGAVTSLGRTAVVRFGAVDIILCHNGGASGDPQLFRHFGIEPTLYDLIVVKANTSFRLPYSKFTDLIYCADTAGAGASNLKLLLWKKLPIGLYPFADEVCPTKSTIW